MSAPGRLVLASASPRRRELLAALALEFEVCPADVDETSAERDPVRLAEGLALRKARAIPDTAAAAAVVLGSDTVVVLGGEPLGKPADGVEAREMLRALRGRDHVVVTGVAAVAGERVAADHAIANVTMRNYTDEEIDRYVASGAPLDKAGAYAIQDTRFAPVAALAGCECAVIGLPLWTTRRLLRVVGGLTADEPAFDRCITCALRPAERIG